MIVTFDKATNDELDEIFELAGKNREEATGIIAVNNKEEMIKAYENSIHHGAYFLVARQSERLVGWVLVDKSMDWFTGLEVGWISDVYVKKEYRKNGYAIELLNQSFTHFKELGYHDVRLNVFSCNDRAISLYEKIGFKDVCKFMKIDI